MFIKYLNTSQSKFETNCGLANGYVNNIRRSITPEKLQKISLRYPELNSGWLMTGEGNMLKDSSTNVGEISGDGNTTGMSVTQTIGSNSGQNAGRDILNPPCTSIHPNILSELKQQRELIERRIDSYISTLDKRDAQIDQLIKQNQDQFNRFMELIDRLQQLKTEI